MKVARARAAAVLVTCVLFVTSCSSGATPDGSVASTGSSSSSTTAGTEAPPTIEGIDGWLFFAPDVDPDCDELARIGDLDRLGLGPDRLRYSVNEPKSALHADRLGPANQPAPCVEATREELREARSADPLSIDLDAAIRAADTEMFFDTDTHWTPEGRMIAARTLIEALAPGLWDPAAVTVAEVPRMNDLGILVGVEVPATITGPQVDRGPVTVTDHRTARTLINEFTTFQVSNSNADQTIAGTTYIVGDSQMAFLLPEIESYFEGLVFINWFSVDELMADLDDLPPPDRLVVQSVERSAATRFAGPELQELAARLPG